MMLSFTEENYLKALLLISLEKSGSKDAGTNEIATFLNVKPATANDMLKKLKEKKLILHKKYGKSSLTDAGTALAVDVVRKHRLWETFLYEKLGFSWDEVHEVAEQLEHIQNKKLIDQLDCFLNFPAFDPHGDVIPTANGEMKILPRTTLAETETGKACIMVGVKDNSSEFLQYVNKLGLYIKCVVTVVNKNDYDNILELNIDGKLINVSSKFAENIVIVYST